MIFFILIIITCTILTKNTVLLLKIVLKISLSHYFHQSRHVPPTNHAATFYIQPRPTYRCPVLFHLLERLLKGEFLTRGLADRLKLGDVVVEVHVNKLEGRKEGIIIIMMNVLYSR